MLLRACEKAEITTHEDGSRSGLSPVIWKAWETTGVDVSFSLSSSSKDTNTLEVIDKELAKSSDR